MRLLVVGAAGRTGRHVVEHAVARGHAVTTLARPAHDLSALQGVTSTVPGDATDPDRVRAAVRNQEAVLMAVASSDILRTLIPAMIDAAVPRLVMTSSRSIVSTRPRWLMALVWWKFREPYADLARAEGMVEASTLEWSIVRATMLDNREWTGCVHTDTEDNATGGDWRLGRSDYATTLLDVLEDPTTIRGALGVGGAR